MNRHPWHPLAAVAAALAVGLACGGDGGPTTPVVTVAVPGTLLLTLTTPAADDGAILFSLSGGAMASPTAVSASHVLFSRSTGASSLNAVIVGNISSGALVTFDVPDINRASSYTATIVEAAARSNALRTSLAGYSFSISPAGG